MDCCLYDFHSHAGFRDDPSHTTHHESQFHCLTASARSWSVSPDTPARKFCYKTLDEVSPKFADSVRNLPPELSDPVCVFYLVLSGLRAIEEDGTLPLQQKLTLLADFDKYLFKRNWRLAGVGDGGARVLLGAFYQVIEVFLSLKEKYQVAIADSTRRMAGGLADFSQRELITIDDYNSYTHFVAGLTGIGLSRCFSASGLEDPSYATRDSESNATGLLLRKTSLIRTFTLDMDMSGRLLWPREVWAQYANNALELRREGKGAGPCLNHMVTDALEGVPAVLSYLSGLRNPGVFRFCAIPQVNAIAMLAQLYNRPSVLSSPTPISLRPGLEAKHALSARSMDSVYRWVHLYISAIEASIDDSDPSAARTRAALAAINAITAPHVPRLFSGLSASDIVLAIASVASVSLLATRVSSGFRPKL